MYLEPYIACVNLTRAIEHRDEAALERTIAFDDLRYNLQHRASAADSLIIEEMVTPNGLMTALRGMGPVNRDDGNDLGLVAVMLSSMRKDASGRYIIANTVSLCSYGLIWKVCDINI